MTRRFLVPALIAVLAAAAPVTLAALAGAPKYLLCEFPGKDGKPGGGPVFHMGVEDYGGMAGAVKACLAKGGRPAGVSDGKKV